MCYLFSYNRYWSSTSAVNSRRRVVEDQRPENSPENDREKGRAVLVIKLEGAYFV